MTIKKGKILRSDHHLYEGIEYTASRDDSSGGLISGLRVNDYVDVLQVYGDGLNRTLATITAATSAIGSTNVTLQFSPGIWTIDDNLTIASNFVCRVPAGCVFNVSSGKTLTFSGSVIQDHSTWTSGSGTVTTNGTRTINGSLSLSGDLTLAGDITLSGDLYPSRQNIGFYHGRQTSITTSASFTLPSGWTGTRDGVGVWHVTHNLGTSNYSLLGSIFNNEDNSNGKLAFYNRGSTSFYCKLRIDGTLTDSTWDFCLILDS